MSDNEENSIIDSDGSEQNGDSYSEKDRKIPIDLSENEVYRGVCTLFEDEEGNNILEYISLLHSELIGINKSLENLKFIKKDISRLADCAELYLKSSDLVIDKTKKSEIKKSDEVKKTKKT